MWIRMDMDYSDYSDYSIYIYIYTYTHFMYADGLKPPTRMFVLVFVTAVRTPSGFRFTAPWVGAQAFVLLHWLMTC